MHSLPVLADALDLTTSPSLPDVQEQMRQQEQAQEQTDFFSERKFLGADPWD